MPDTRRANTEVQNEIFAPLVGNTRLIVFGPRCSSGRIQWFSAKGVAWRSLCGPPSARKVKLAQNQPLCSLTRTVFIGLAAPVKNVECDASLTRAEWVEPLAAVHAEPNVNRCQPVDRKWSCATSFLPGQTQCTDAWIYKK